MTLTGSYYIDYVHRDLSRWVRDQVRVGVTGAFGIPGENEN